LGLVGEGAPQDQAESLARLDEFLEIAIGEAIEGLVNEFYLLQFPAILPANISYRCLHILRVEYRAEKGLKLGLKDFAGASREIVLRLL
jgi:hypothetical protein